MIDILGGPSFGSMGVLMIPPLCDCIYNCLLIDSPLITTPGTGTVDQKSFNFLISHTNGIIIANSALVIIRGAPLIVHTLQT